MDESDINETNAALALGQCHFQQVLGKGSFGRVVRAIHKVNESLYAIKMMISDSEERIKYQKRELGLLTKLQLSHRNIIQYFDSWLSVVENKQTLCIQMELCWLSLEDYVLKNGVYNPSITIVKDEKFYKHIFPQILNGLDAIHSVGWVHRDIHPGNILIANPKPSGIQDIVIKIADFGLARRIAEVVDSSSTFLTVKPKLDELSPNVGSELFRAPELSTQHYDYKVDLFSAGIVLYFLCRYLEDAKQWECEIEQLRAGKRKRDHLCHNDEMLVQLLDNLLKINPVERPSARAALDTFLLNETDAGVNSATSKSGVNFLAKKEGAVEYNRCSTPHDSLDGIMAAVENVTGIRRENQLLRQESIVDEEKILVNINCDEDVKEMFKSAAEKTNSKVKLIVSGKTSPGIEYQAYTPVLHVDETTKDTD